MEEMEAVYQIHAAMTPRWIVRDLFSSKAGTSQSFYFWSITTLNNNNNIKIIILNINNNLAQKKTIFFLRKLSFLYYWEYTNSARYEKACLRFPSSFLFLYFYPRDKVLRKMGKLKKKTKKIWFEKKFKITIFKKNK